MELLDCTMQVAPLPALQPKQATCHAMQPTEDIKYVRSAPRVDGHNNEISV